MLEIIDRSNFIVLANILRQIPLTLWWKKFPDFFPWPFVPCLPYLEFYPVPGNLFHTFNCAYLSPHIGIRTNRNGCTIVAPTNFEQVIFTRNNRYNDFKAKIRFYGQKQSDSRGLQHRFSGKTEDVVGISASTNMYLVHGFRYSRSRDGLLVENKHI